MKRQLRRSLRKIERKLSRARSYATSFVRSNSSYPHYLSATPASSMVSSTISDSDDDNVFGATASDESPTIDDDRRTSITLLPCEFCHVQHSSDNLIHHQIRCRENPNRIRGRNTTPTTTATGRRRRAISEYTTAVPSAPPRTRSPSPTEGFIVPNELLCPITSVIFRDPVVANDGHTYEREAITQWLQQRRVSPMTREPLSLDKIIPNRVVKKMVDDFLAECRRKRLLYKYKLDVNVKKTEQVPYIKTNTKSLYRAEWLNNNSSSTNPNIILMHLTGENAEKISESNCRLQLHPNIVRVFGRVEHSDTGILLVQEHPSPQTLSQLIKNPDQKLSITHVDFILHQISSALEHLANAEIIHGNITADNVLIYHLDEAPKNTLVKLNTIGHVENDINIHTISPEVLSRNSHSEKSDVYTFGILAREMCLLEIETNEEGLLERQALFERCLVVDPNDRPTFNELTKAILDFIHEEMCILECSSSV